MAPNQNREAIIALYKNGKSQKEIVSLLKVLQPTVSKAIYRFKELGTSADRPRSGRPTKVSTPKMIERIRSRINRNPTQSMRKMAKQLGVDKKTVQNIVKKKLKRRSYKTPSGQVLSEAAKQSRLEKCRHLKKLFKNQNFLRTVLFSDEKIFTIEANANSRQILKKRQGKPNFVSSFK